MITYDLDKASSILTVHPESSLDKDDFDQMAKAIDPEIEPTAISPA